MIILTFQMRKPRLRWLRTCPGLHCGCVTELVSVQTYLIIEPELLTTALSPHLPARPHSQQTDTGTELDSRVGRFYYSTTAQRSGVDSSPRESSHRSTNPICPKAEESGWLSSGFTLKDRAPGQIKVGPERGRLHLKIIIIACTFFNELSFPLGSKEH